MIKKVFFFSLCAICLCACGPSQEEIERQERIDDSIFEAERNIAIENANKLLNDTVVTDTIKKDSIKK